MILAGVVCGFAAGARLVAAQETFRCFSGTASRCLDLVSRALSAGHAFSEALHMVSEEMPEPSPPSFAKLTKNRTLVSVKLALENLTQRMPLLDLKMCVTAV